MNKEEYFKKIPKVDLILEDNKIKSAIDKYSYDVVLDSVQNVTSDLRDFIKTSSNEDEIINKINSLIDDVINLSENISSSNMKSVINASGTILHTNLGRAVLSKKHITKAIDIISGYCNLEYNLEKGERGERYSHFEKLLCKITGAEAAMAVNNNASSEIFDGTVKSLEYTNTLKSEGKLIDSVLLLQNPYKELVSLLIAGPTNSNLCNVFPENTKVLDAYIENDLVTIDFSDDILNFESEEQKFNIINSVLNTLCELNEVNAVKFLVNNEQNKIFNDKFIH